MPDSVVTVSPLWTVPAAVFVVVLACVAASFDGVLAARAEGSAWRGGVGRPFWEVARLLRQRRRVTVAADTLLWRAGGGGLLLAALLMVVVVPLGRWTTSDLAVGVVWFNAMDVMVWALMWLAGWGANSALSLVGGYRFLAQALAYELPLMFALTAPAVGAGSLRVGEVAAAQHTLWFVFWMPLAFAIYCVGVVAFSVWGPFAPAVGVDLAGGVLVELSGVDRLLVQAGRYSLLAAGSVFAVPMFLGGGSGPVLPGWAWALVKAVVLLGVLVAARRRFPALRPDRFMEVGWVVLLPAALLQVLIVAVVVVVRS